MTVTIRFLGAAGTVTGSKYLVEHGGQSLMVDSGHIQETDADFANRHGYQAPGTRGATLTVGGSYLRMHGKDLPVRAEIVQLTAASAHADASQLLDWLRSMPSSPQRVFITHGDPETSDQLRQRIERELKWHALVPEHGSIWPA